MAKNTRRAATPGPPPKKKPHQPQAPGWLGLFTG